MFDSVFFFKFAKKFSYFWFAFYFRFFSIFFFFYTLYFVSDFEDLIDLLGLGAWSSSSFGGGRGSQRRFFIYFP